MSALELVSPWVTALKWAKRLWFLIPLLAVSCLYVVTKYQRDEAIVQRDVLIVWQKDVTEAVSAATVPDGKMLKPAQVKGALAGLVRDRTNARAALKSISKETLAAKARANQADAALVRVQSENTKKFAAAQRTIAELEHRKSTGIPAKDQGLIEEDSKQAWKGWK